MMGRPPVSEGGLHCRVAEFDVTSVTFRFSGADGLSGRVKEIFLIYANVFILQHFPAGSVLITSIFPSPSRHTDPHISYFYSMERSLTTA